MKTAICPGSFDPITLGHLDIIARASKLFDKVIVAVCYNAEKDSARQSFNVKERIDLINRSISGISGVEVAHCDMLLADFAKEKGACAIVKGLRAVSDFEYEFQMALINKKLNDVAETIFLTARAENMYLSSSIVKQIAFYDGDISDFVPAPILKQVEDRLIRKKD